MLNFDLSDYYLIDSGISDVIITKDNITFTASAGPAGCVALTPTFDKIGK
jgi:hypothetical protein